MSNDKWTKLEDKIYSAARTANANKHSIDSDISMPINKKELEMTNTQSKPWSKIANCGQSSPPWPKANTATQYELPMAAAVADCGQAVALAQSNTQVTKYEIDSDVVQLKRVDNRTRLQQIGFQKGQSGNPKGRPKGAKTKITELARSIVIDDFEKHGAKTLERVRIIDPVSYLRVVLHFVPKELLAAREKGHCIDLADLNDEEFIEILEEARKRNMYERIMKSDAKAEEERYQGR